MVYIIALVISYSSVGVLAVFTIVLMLCKREYFIFDPRLLFVIGLVFSRAVAEYAITIVLAWYFTYYGDHLVVSSVLSNIQSSLSSLFVIFMAHSADNFVGRFQTLLFSNTAYIGGMMILWLFNPYDVKWLVVISLVLLSLGTSGANTLYCVLEESVHDIDNKNDKSEERSLIRAEIWFRIAYTSGAVSATLWVATDSIGGVQQSWRSAFLICIIAMTVTSIIFRLGHKNYRQIQLTKRPIQIFFKVFGDCIKKFLKCNSLRSMNISRQNSSSKNSETEKMKEEGIPEESDMKVIRSLLRMFPMWGMFFVVSIISATGATFYFQQYTNLNVNKEIPIQINNIAQDFSSFAIPLLYSKINCFGENEKTKKEKVRIGIGMLCGILSCIFAWRLEVHRLKKVSYLVDKDLNTSISFLWLVPQFIALGCMEGLTREGVLELYKLQMEHQPKLKNYGVEYIEIVMGLGKLMNIILVVIVNSLKGWFGDTINDSRLDRYYLVLVYVCSVNFILYCVIAIFKYKEQGLANNNQQGNQDLPDDAHEQDRQEAMANIFDYLEQENDQDDQEQDSEQVSADYQGQNN